APGGVRGGGARGAAPAAAGAGAGGWGSRGRARGGAPAGARFARRTAWRALMLADAVAPEFRAPAIHLWLGHGSHLVHYPVKAGTMINILAIPGDEQPRPSLTTAAAAHVMQPRVSHSASAAG